MPTDPTGAIDTHAHIYPAGYLDRLEAGGVPASTTKVARGLRADSTPDDLAHRLEWMDRAGVDTQVIAVTPQSPFLADPRQAAQAAHWINDEYARIMADHPGRFLAYAALPLPHTEQSVAELDRILDQPGFVGVSINTFLPGARSLTEPQLDDVWAALDERRAVVNIHPTGSGLAAPLITDLGLEWVNGALIEDATAVLHLMKADIPARYPKIRFHIAHLGGDLPFMSQRLEDNYEGWNAFKHSPRETLRGMWFDAANFYEPSLALAAQTFGASQILAGSDIPYFQDEKYVRAFDYIRTSRLEEAEKQDVLRRNALALYRR